MNWQDIKVSEDNRNFLFEGKPLFVNQYIAIQKFHSPGLAPVKDETGSYHINNIGIPLYIDRYTRTFGYYCNRAAVILGDNWFHLTELGDKAYSNSYSWTGNYQENLCTVRDYDNKYYHIDLSGNKVYSQTFFYCGDYKDGYACAKTIKGNYRHIDVNGNFLCNKEFVDLGVFHKNIATAKDKDGWYHIDKQGNEIYKNRYLAVEPFYNGFALVTKFGNQKIIIDELGETILRV